MRRRIETTTALTDDLPLEGREIKVSARETLRLHVVSLPHTQTTKDYVHCAYTEKVRKFCDMMKSQGSRVLLYAGDENEATPYEHIPCITRDEQRKLIGMEHPTDNAKLKWDSREPCWKLMNKRAIEAIRQRIQPRDFICLIGGGCQRSIADAFPAHMAVEFGVGYAGVFAKYRVFESYAWMHTVYGATQGAYAADGAYYDAVIPNYFDVTDFPFSAEKDDYFLYIGRLIDRKGYNVAVETCQRKGLRLLIAGQGDPPEFGEYVGVVGAEERGRLMSRAQGVFVPTNYVEPFGGVAVEAMLCGTPIITTDWGAFTETNEHGVTGYRCRTLQEFCDATDDVRSLDYAAIRRRAIEKYSLEAVGPMYREYFDRLLGLWGDGWYSLRKGAGRG